MTSQFISKMLSKIIVYIYIIMEETSFESKLDSVYIFFTSYHYLENHWELIYLIIVSFPFEISHNGASANLYGIHLQM